MKQPTDKQVLERLKELWEEYRDEALHQDGNGYFKQFKDLKELLADFALYVQNVE